MAGLGYLSEAINLTEDELAFAHGLSTRDELPFAYGSPLPHHARMWYRDAFLQEGFADADALEALTGERLGNDDSMPNWNEP